MIFLSLLDGHKWIKWLIYVANSIPGTYYTFNIRHLVNILKLRVSKEELPKAIKLQGRPWSRPGCPAAFRLVQLSAELVFGSGSEALEIGIKLAQRVLCTVGASPSRGCRAVAPSWELGLSSSAGPLYSMLSAYNSVKYSSPSFHWGVYVIHSCMCSSNIY